MYCTEWLIYHTMFPKSRKVTKFCTHTIVLLEPEATSSNSADVIHSNIHISASWVALALEPVVTLVLATKALEPRTWLICHHSSNVLWHCYWDQIFDTFTVWREHPIHLSKLTPLGHSNILIGARWAGTLVFTTRASEPRTWLNCRYCTDIYWHC